MPDVPQQEHIITVSNRDEAIIQGVEHVESFNDTEIVVQTTMGMLCVQGEELRIQELNVDSGHLTVNGVIQTVSYLDDGPMGAHRGKGIFGRLFR